MESTRAMTRERGSRAESKTCKILLLPTADRHFDTKVKCPTGRASFWVKYPTVRSLMRVKCPGIAGGWMEGFGIDWYITKQCSISSMSWCLLFIHRLHKLNIWLLIQYETRLVDLGNCLYWSKIYYQYQYTVKLKTRPSIHSGRKLFQVLVEHDRK